MNQQLKTSSTARKPERDAKGRFIKAQTEPETTTEETSEEWEDLVSKCVEVIMKFVPDVLETSPDENEEIIPLSDMIDASCVNDIPAIISLRSIHLEWDLIKAPANLKFFQSLMEDMGTEDDTFQKVVSKAVELQSFEQAFFQTDIRPAEEVDVTALFAQAVTKGWIYGQKIWVDGAETFHDMEITNGPNILIRSTEVWEYMHCLLQVYMYAYLMNNPELYPEVEW